MMRLKTANLFVDALCTDGPIPELSSKMTMYDPLLGDWEMDVIDYNPDGTQRKSKGECHFAWVLEGRAIQDLWIVPPRLVREGSRSLQGNRYGTTLRVYDPANDVWHVTWINPVNGAHTNLVGRKQGDRIVQEGKAADGSINRWTFLNMTSNSFHWRGEVSSDNGNTWRLTVEFFGHRVGANRSQE